MAIRFEKRSNTGNTGKDIYDYIGASTDTKPTEDVGDYSLFFEMDTGDIYYFNGTSWEAKA